MGVTIMALLPPSSRMARPKRSPATFTATWRPMRGARGADHRHLRTGGKQFAQRLAPADQELASDPRAPVPGLSALKAAHGLQQQMLAGDGRERRFSDGFQTMALPQTRPGRHSTTTRRLGVEGRDDAHHAHGRVPSFACNGQTAGNRQAVQLARQADGGRRCRSSPAPRPGPRQ